MHFHHHLLTRFPICSPFLLDSLFVTNLFMFGFGFLQPNFLLFSSPLYRVPSQSFVSALSRHRKFAIANQKMDSTSIIRMCVVSVIYCLFCVFCSSMFGVSVPPIASFTNWFYLFSVHCRLRIWPSQWVASIYAEPRLARCRIHAIRISRILPPSSAQSTVCQR